MIIKLDHIGIAVNNLEESAKFYTEIFGLKLDNIELVEEQKVKVGFIPVGDTEIELLEATSEESVVAKFIRNKGQGVHHIAYRVENIEEAIESFKSKGMRFINEVPKTGAGSARTAFIHPKDTGGVLVEICERVLGES